MNQKRAKKSGTKEAAITSLHVGGRGSRRRDIPIIWEPVFLSKEEDDARIRRLSRKILDVLEHAARERNCRPRKRGSVNNNPLHGMKNPLLDE